MDEDASITLLEQLANTFNVAANCHYRKNDRKWVVSLEGLYECVESRSTMREQGGTTRKMLAGSEVSAMRDSFAEAVEALADRTIRKPVVFLSNRAFGLFSGSDDDTPVITRFEYGEKRESMAYREDTLRAAMVAHGLATLPYKPD